MVKVMNCHVWYVKVKETVSNVARSRRSVGSSFHRQCAAFRKEWLVIFKEDRVGGRARVTIDEKRVLWQGWTEIKCRRNIEIGLLWELYMLEKGVYIWYVHLFGASVEIQESREKIFAFWWQHEQESSGYSWVFLSETVEDYSTVSYSSQVWNKR